MVFPRDALITRDLGERVMSGLKSLWPWGKKNEASSMDNFDVPEYHIMLQNCLMLYIAPYRRIISTGQFSDSLPIAMVVERIHHVFTCLLETQFTYKGRPRIHSFKLELKKQPLQEVFLYIYCITVTFYSCCL